MYSTSEDSLTRFGGVGMGQSMRSPQIFRVLDVTANAVVCHVETLKGELVHR